MTPILIIVVSALASARTWRLLAIDDIALSFRNAYYSFFSLFGEKGYLWGDALLTCPFCLGFWVTAIWVTVGLLSGGALWWLIPAGVFAANFVGGQLNAWLDVRPVEDKTEIGDHE